MQDPKTSVMTIEIISTIGNVVFITPEILERLGFTRDICGTHPFVVLDVKCRDGFTECLVVPLTTKGSRHSAVRLPDEFLRGTIFASLTYDTGSWTPGGATAAACGSTRASERMPHRDREKIRWQFLLGRCPPGLLPLRPKMPSVRPSGSVLSWWQLPARSAWSAV